MTLKLSISNIAWDTNRDEEIASILNQEDISFIDIAPKKYFNSCIGRTKNEIKELKKYWNLKGISIFGMQSLLYEVSNLNIFNSKKDRKELLLYLEEICIIAEYLSAKKLVFGCPKNRFINNHKANNLEIAEEFFYKLDNIAKLHGVTICIEPIPEIYGSNFLKSTREVFKFLKKIKHSNLKIQFDTGSLDLNKENPESIFMEYAEYIGYVHISQPSFIQVYIKFINVAF